MILPTKRFFIVEPYIMSKNLCLYIKIFKSKKKIFIIFFYIKYIFFYKINLLLITHDINFIGFTGVDGEILTSFAKFYLKKGYLSPKQKEILMKKMSKYWKQILEMSDKEKLEKQVEKWMKINE